MPAVPGGRPARSAGRHPGRLPPPPATVRARTRSPPGTTPRPALPAFPSGRAGQVARRSAAQLADGAFPLFPDLQEVVLCGHSYGGAVVTRVADEIPDRLGAIVYLDAFRPADGETIVELAGWDVPVEETMAPPPAAVLGLEGENAAFVERKMMPHPSRALTARMRGRKPLATHIAPTYVLATGWHGVPHFTAVYEEARTDSRWTSMLVDSSHDPMIDRPQVVVDALMTAAGRRSAL